MKEMADLLRKGATMLGESCPICGTPLFKLRDGEIICPKCNRPVRFVESEKDVSLIDNRGSLEETLLKKIMEIKALLDYEKEPKKIREVTKTLIALLEALDMAKKVNIA
jgi:UPF0148 protein